MRYTPLTPEERAQITAEIRALLPMTKKDLQKTLHRSQKIIDRCYPYDEPTIEPVNYAELPDAVLFNWEDHWNDFIIMEEAA